MTKRLFKHTALAAILIVVQLLSTTLMAQTLRVVAPATVSEGQQFTVRFEVNERASQFKGPTFKGFSTLSGPGTSSNSSMSIVNGKVSHTVSTTFTYLLLADQTGTFTIGSASCTANGNTISSEPFTIKVEKGNPQQQQQQQQRNQGGWGDPFGHSQPQQPATIDNKSLFARASISKNSLYEGEQAIITYKIYTQVPVSQYQIDKLPGNKGFWAEDLSEGKEVKQYEETVDGRRYMVAEIRRGALYAQESGQLRIEPLNLDVLAIVQQQRRRTGTIWDLFDDPFFNRQQSVQKHLTTNPINVNVKPLPPAPDHFYGGVGSFDISGGVNTNEVKANEAITYRITISGNGNLMLINEPSITLSNAFEVYDPQVKDKISRNDGGISGSRTYEWIIIPRTQGDYEIPAFQFAYFNPKSSSYVTKTVEAIQLHVAKGDASSMQNVSSSKTDVKVLNNDINYIKTNESHFVDADKQNAPQWWFWTLLTLMVMATIAVVIVGRRRQEAQKDVAGMRLRRATREARKRLKKAATHLNDGNDNSFYEEIYKAIWGCLADKYNIPLSTLSSDTVRDILAERRIAQEQQDHILKTLTDVDFARFAPGDPASKKQQIYNEALEMIASL
ncbi:MAG: protein BatD [Bacteroidales bacterium]|nr:protein BatD [Bacteroidales bacterium]